MDGIEVPAGSSDRESDAVKQLRACAFRRLERLRRVVFKHDQNIDFTRGAVELTFDGIRPMVLDVGTDGESLVAKTGPWIDPFESPLSQDNQEWIANHGKWEAVDVSRERPFIDLVGSTLRSVWLLRTEADKLCGARLQFDLNRLDVVCNGDEVMISIPPDDLKLSRERVYTREQIVSEFDSPRTRE